MGALVAGGLLAGCTNTPIRTGHVSPPQAELASTSHWSAMARNAGFQLAPFLQEQVPVGSRFYVQGHAGDTDFDQVFRRTLITELRGKGLTVVPTRAQASHVLVYGTRVTDHPAGALPPTGTFTSLGAGFWALSALSESGAPFGAVTTVGGALADIGLATSGGAVLSEVTLSIAVLGRDGGEINRQTTYYVSRASAKNYPELALPPMYAASGRALPEPPVAHFIVE
jgi:hypothetical protein